MPSVHDPNTVRSGLDQFSGDLDAAVAALRKIVEHPFAQRDDILLDVIRPAENSANAASRLALVLADHIDPIAEPPKD
jgi:hypothetical protein